MARWKIAAINFDHFHMGDNLRMVAQHPDAEIVGVCDERPERMQEVVRNLAIPQDRVFADYRRCIELTRPEIVLLCPATAHHGEWTERIAEFGVHILIEKPFAASLAEADRMIAATQAAGVQLAINWPLAWYPPHRTTKRLVDEGLIGTVLEVHFYDGNRGPLWHTADKRAKTAGEVEREKSASWFYQRARGGGSLLDYLGYGTTLGTWFLDGRKPLEVTTTVYEPEGLEVDEQSVTVARYPSGLSTFQTRWGTFTDPWVHQPQPKCGFVIVGSEGTITSYDYESTIYVQTREAPAGRAVPVDSLRPPEQNPVQYVLDCLAKGRSIDGPVSPQISRIGQQIVDSAVQSAAQKRSVRLIE
jgi:glucose-fructose oxidoreductase